MKKFSILGDMMVYRATNGALSNKEVLSSLAIAHPNEEFSADTINRLYALMDRVCIKGEYSKGFDYFITHAWYPKMDSTNIAENYKTLERYWLIMGYIFNTDKSIQDIWEYLQESETDKDISLETTKKFVETMVKSSDFIVIGANGNYIIPFGVANTSEE